MATMEDRRKSTRAEVNEIGFIFCAGSSTRCQIVNISDHGAAIDVPEASCIPQRFRLMTESDRKIHSCTITWMKQNRIGVEFQLVLEEPDSVTHPQRQFLQY